MSKNYQDSQHPIRELFVTASITQAELNIFLSSNHQLETRDRQITKLFLPNSETIPKLLRSTSSLKV